MLEGKAALVTNVCHFVGVAAAETLQAHGAKVLCHDSSFGDEQARQAFASDHSTLNLLAETETGAAVDATVDALGHLDIAVINDFYPAVRAPIEEASLDDYRDGLEALMVVPFATAAAAARHMKPRKEGKLIFVTSAAPLHGLPNYCMYAAGRGGANALALSVAKELAQYNIQVNAVAPNYVESESYFPKALLADEQAVAKMTSKVPMGRLGKPQEVGELIAFLASNQSDFITAQVIPIAGGWA